MGVRRRQGEVRRRAGGGERLLVAGDRCAVLQLNAAAFTAAAVSHCDQLHQESAQKASSGEGKNSATRWAGGGAGGKLGGRLWPAHPGVGQRWEGSECATARARRVGRGGAARPEGRCPNGGHGWGAGRTQIGRGFQGASWERLQPAPAACGHAWPCMAPGMTPLRAAGRLLLPAVSMGCGAAVSRLLPSPRGAAAGRPHRACCAPLTDASPRVA